jgi:ABC-type bacteriocin/lantibiotic exporter with double-glycine peptidase domain
MFKIRAKKNALRVATSMLPIYTAKRISATKEFISKMPSKRFGFQRQHIDVFSYFKKGLNNQDLQTNFEFDNLGLKLKNGKELLKGVTGRIRAGRMTAIMGPSGAGVSSTRMH